MFNGLAIILVIVSAFTVCGVYFILQPFIKPLLWALLVGSTLHPIKQLIANKLRTQVDILESSSRPIYVNVLMMPLSCVNQLSDTCGDFLVTHVSIIAKFIVGLAAVALSYLYTPNIIWRLCNVFVGLNQSLLNFVLDLFNSTMIVFSLLLSFLAALMFLWKPEYKFLFSCTSAVIWIAGTAWTANIFYYFRFPVFVLLQLSLGGGYVYLLTSESRTANEATAEKSQENEDNVFTFSGNAPPTENPPITSLSYIRWLGVVCVGVFLISIPWFPYFILLLFIIYVVKLLCYSFGVVDTVYCQVETSLAAVNCWYVERKDVLLPRPLDHMLQLFGKMRDRFLVILKDCCDSAAAVAVIMGLLIFGIFISVFFTVQAYRETVYLVQTGGSIINNTVVHNPEIHQMLPEDWQTTMEMALDNAYLYVRDALAKLVRNLLKGKGISDEKSFELEKGAIELWDRAYQAWVMPNQPAIGPTVTPDAVLSSCYNFVERLKKTPEVMSWNSAKDFIQENMSTLQTGFDSVWSILRGNMSLLLGIFSTLFSLVFGGGLSVINFTLHSVVFLTALFYLLSSSRELYKPVEMITQMSPKYGNKLATAVELSCREVLAASAKLSVFYGMWTWLIHMLFQSNLVYMPAVFAGVLGVIPILGTYWACLPAILDLWLMQGSKLRALGLFLAQIFPTTVIETTVYNEIKGSGHPYLTGLSIAGGMFWLGIEGAIAGPLVLCFLFTILNMLSGLENINVKVP
ncbi:transmembrane protein 245 [Nesidiocoris tenuis]|uniref:Transmembrane protein 245 n=1 Tax=Nesidiocoris tenuis TaxID=355587 RepID=A0ABN7B5P6_9HEMI|nr:transmembrane protein 245 [Nesidiocoris tenuis]